MLNPRQSNRPRLTERWIRGLVLLLATSLGGCKSRPSSESLAARSLVQATGPSSTTPDLGESSAPASAAQRGQQLVRHFECGRCHEVKDEPPVPLEKHCVRCHAAILDGSFAAPAAALGKWRRTIVNLREVPDLRGAVARLDANWLVEFLVAPVDTRPHLGATMPRFRMTRAEAQDIVAFLTSRWPTVAVSDAETPQTPAPPHSTSRRTAPPNGAIQDNTGRKGAKSSDTSSSGTVLTQSGRHDAAAFLGSVLGLASQGSDLFAQKACGSCHDAAATTPSRGVDARAFRLAPDLRYTRQRMTFETTVAWLLEPRRFSPNTLMPNHGLEPREAKALADYLFSLPSSEPLDQGTATEAQGHNVSQTPTGLPVGRLPLLERPVSYAEVERAVFRQTCWHCHSQPDLMRGDGGPGMTGGFGFDARHLDLSTYSAALGGYDARDGQPVSLFQTLTETGESALVSVLLARQAEERGVRAELRGMPLGLPALTPEQIQLVASWVDQGRPQ